MWKSENVKKFYNAKIKYAIWLQQSVPNQYIKVADTALNEIL
jgi:hypothetical protein